MQSAAVNFVAEAFAHLRVIGQTAAAQPLLQKGGVMPDQGIIAMNGSADAFLGQAANGGLWHREPNVRAVY